MSNKTQLQTNNTKLDSLIETLRGKAVGGVDLPELSNPGTSAELLAGYELIDGTGNKVTGAMTNNGAISSTMDGIDTKSITVPAGYTTGGTISLDSTIDDTAAAQAVKIAEIEALLEGKSAGSGDGSGDGSVETGTLIGMTTLLADPSSTTYYYDLDTIPNLASKNIIFFSDIASNMSSIYYLCLYRETTSDAFIISQYLGTAVSSLTISDNIMSLTTSIASMSELSYIAK